MSQAGETTARKYWAVVPAAGAGHRMQSKLPKQYLEIAGKTILEHSVERLLAFTKIEQVVIAVNTDDEHWRTNPLASHSRCRFVSGGDTRAASVFAGLMALSAQAAADDWVIVHDAARPGIHADLINSLLSACEQHNCGGLLALPVRDTLKQVTADRVVTTVSRNQLWQAQTPQCFPFAALMTALSEALANDDNITDEAMAMEAAGHEVLVLRGDVRNMKITYPEDTQLLEYCLRESI